MSVTLVSGDQALIESARQSADRVARPNAVEIDHADAFLTTLRRTPEAESNDQVLALIRRDQMEMESQGSRNPMGMRWTRSPGFIVHAEIPRKRMMSTPFSEISAESMTPVSHAFWSRAWLGVATDAFDRACAFAKAAAKRSSGSSSAAATRPLKPMSKLSLLRAECRLALREFCDISADSRSRFHKLATILGFNNLKIAASDQAPLVCQEAVSVCGIMGYKNDTPFNVGRNLRDSMSARLMVANQRIRKTDASLLLIAKDV